MVDFLLHFYRKGSTPFQTLSDLPDDAAVLLMQGMYLEGSMLWERFKDPVWYLQARRQTELWLRREFIAKGGQPIDAYPIYLVLGRPPWISRVMDPGTAATGAEIQVPIALFNAEEISFTYPDSMVTSLLAYEKRSEYYQPEYHGKVFTLPEILAIVAEKGLPDEGWTTNVPDTLAHYVEAQVWNRQVLLEYWRTVEAGSRGDA